MEKNTLCAGCNVNTPFEHRCHGKGCDCTNAICMERQGKITHEELLKIVNNELNAKNEVSTRYQFPTIVEPDPEGDHRVVAQDGPLPNVLHEGTKEECLKWQKENC